VALDVVLDDALGSASADLIAVLACTSSPCSCHPCTWRGSRRGSRLPSSGWRTSLQLVATGIMNEAPMICGS
jgi:hypothetical protein